MYRRCCTASRTFALVCSVIVGGLLLCMYSVSTPPADEQQGTIYVNWLVPPQPSSHDNDTGQSSCAIGRQMITALRAQSMAPLAVGERVYASRFVQFLRTANAHLPLLLVDVVWLRCLADADMCAPVRNATVMNVALSDALWHCLPMLVSRYCPVC